MFLFIIRFNHVKTIQTKKGGSMRKDLQTVIDKLATIREKIEIALEKAEDVENPNEDRIKVLEQEIEAIGAAIDELESLD